MQQTFSWYTISLNSSVWSIPWRVIIFMWFLLLSFLHLSFLELLSVYLEVQLPAELDRLIKTPYRLRAVCDGVPGLVVEALGLLGIAEEHRNRELALIAALWLVDEVDQIEVLVKTPCAEV